MPTKRKALLVLLAVAAMIGISTVAWHALHPSEPMHKGRPISDWIDAIGRGKIISIETRKEFREMGPVAVPYLIKGLQRQNSKLFSVQAKLYNKLPKWMSAKMPRPCNAVTIRYECASILREMQANAVPAFPALIDALSDDQLSVRMSAAFALGVIRDHWPKSDPARTNYDAQAVNALVKLMSDPNGEAQGNAAGSIQFFGDAANNAIPSLVQIANKGSGYGRSKSIETLIEIKGVTPDMTPMLKLATRSPDRNLATSARRALNFLNSQTIPDAPVSKH